MISIFQKAIVIFFMISATALATGPNDIAYMTEQYPPFNFEDQGKIQGIIADTMLAMMKKLDVDRPIKVLPWANSYNKIQTVPNTCLFGMTYTPERAPLFKWVGPVTDTEVTLFALKKNHIQIKSIEDINRYKTGVIRSDIGEQLLLKNGVKPDRIDPVAQTDQNLKKLIAGRVDLIAYSKKVLIWQIKQSGLNVDDFDIVYSLSKGELFIAFHKDTPDSIIQAFQKELDTIKSDGTYKAIADKYLK